MDLTLKGKNALVTGGNRGIGAQVVRQLAAAGASVGLHCRTPHENAEQMAEELSREYGVTVREIVGDFSDPNSITDVFKQFDELFPQIDILVNNAGFENTYALEELPLEAWQMLMQVNLTAPFQCAQLAAQRMKKTGGGVIINMQSIHDEITRKGVAHYSVAKAGLKMLTRAAGVEWGEYGIRVVGISPGAIETDINRDDIEKMGRDKYNRWIPAGHVGETPDIADAVVFLSSNHARYINATTIYIDGGYMHNVIRYDERKDHDIDG